MRFFRGRFGSQWLASFTLKVSPCKNYKCHSNETDCFIISVIQVRFLYVCPAQSSSLGHHVLLDSLQAFGSWKVLCLMKQGIQTPQIKADDWHFQVSFAVLIPIFFLPSLFHQKFHSLVRRTENRNTFKLSVWFRVTAFGGGPGINPVPVGTPL